MGIGFISTIMSATLVVPIPKLLLKNIEKYWFPIISFWNFLAKALWQKSEQ